MTTTRTVLATWRDLLDSVDYDTMLPKFPAHATACVKELAAVARELDDFPDKANVATHEITEPDSPEQIFWAALKKTARCDEFSVTFEFLPYMPLLENALDAQPRCRVCGCTDYNACLCGCSWVENDLCSECYAKEGGNTNGE